MQTLNQTGRSPRKRRVILLGLFSALLVMAILPFSGLLLVGDTAAQATTAVANPAADLWRQARESVSGVTTDIGQEASVLITNSGQNFRQIRNGPLANIAGWFLGFTLFVIVMMYLFQGAGHIKNGRSGLSVERWSMADRVLHWYVAILFIILAITGLSFLYGRAVVMPVIGKEAFAAYAGLAIYVHNYLGVFFAAGLVVMIVKWLSHNFYEKTDLGWFKGGGPLKSNHAPVGFVNPGHKLLFWTIVFAGMAIVVTGILLITPNLGWTREIMQISLIIHAIAAIGLIAFIMGHIYMATVMVKGSMEGMIGGRVDVNWAKQHHPLWYKELEEQGVKPVPTAAPTSAADAVDTAKPAAS